MLRRGEQLLEFRRQLDNQKIQFEDQLSGQIYSWDMAKIYREINNGELHIFRADSAKQESDSDRAAKGLPILLASLDSLPEKYRSDLERKFDYIKTLQKQGFTRGMRARLKNAISKIASRRVESAPSTSTVMNWWRRFDESGSTPGALVTGYAKKKRKQKIPADVLEIIRKITKKEYFTLDRHPLTRAVLLVNRALSTTAKPEDGSAHVTKVSASTVRRVANEVSPYFQDLARFGPAYTRNKWRYSLKGTMTSRVLERVEIDHTLLDMVVVCDKSGLPLGRPTITVVIDAHSGYVLSFFVSFWGTGVGPALNALKIAIMPKDNYCEAASTLNNPWLGYGLFELIVVDNGLEFHSRQFQSAIWQLSADIQYCAVRQPWLKPSVERSLGVQNLYLPGNGKVHKPLSNYLPPDPKKTACITFSNLAQGLLKYFVDILPMQANSRTLVEPFEVFKEGFERLPPPLLPSSLDELDLIGAMSKKLTVGNEGVVFDYLRYNSTDLQLLRKDTSHTYTTTVKYRPENLDFAYVQDPNTKDWLLVPSCQPEYTNQLSIVQHKAIRIHKKGELQKRNAIEVLTRGKLELIDLYDGFLTGNRGKKNVKAAQQFGTLTSAQTLTSSTLNQGNNVSESQLITKTDFEMHDRVIPTFDSFILD